MAMLNFAVPGTVVGIAYILAFNAPPIELAYTGLILVSCFVFRDMTTSMRAGLAALSQIDPSLDEASATLRASTLTTIRRDCAAADPASGGRCADLQLHQCDDVDQRRHLPDQPALRHGDRQHRRSRRGRRIRLRDRVRVGADRADGGGGDTDSRARGHARDCRAATAPLDDAACQSPSAQSATRRLRRTSLRRPEHVRIAPICRACWRRASVAGWSRRCRGFLRLAARVLRRTRQDLPAGSSSSRAPAGRRARRR